MFAHAPVVTCRHRTGSIVNRRLVVSERQETHALLNSPVFQAPTVTVAFVVVVLATSKSLDSVSLERRQDVVARCNENKTKYSMLPHRTVKFALAARTVMVVFVSVRRAQAPLMTFAIQQHRFALCRARFALFAFVLFVL